MFLVSSAMGDDARQKASDFLEGQQHYYRQLRQHKQDLSRFRASRAEHLAAVELLGELPKKVRRARLRPLLPGRRQGVADPTVAGLCEAARVKRTLPTWRGTCPPPPIQD